MGIPRHFTVLLVAIAITGCATSAQRVRQDSVAQVKLTAKPSREAAACVAGNAKKLGMSSRIEQGRAPMDFIVVASYQPGNVAHAAAITDVKTYYDEGTSLRTYTAAYAGNNLGTGLQDGC